MNDAISPTDELLHAFIDDELAPESEEQFYAHLASDADLRTRLRQLRSIRGEALRFRTAAAPPSDLSDAVFTNLGFDAKPARSGARTLGAALLLHRVWSPVASAAAAAAITATLILGLQNPASPDRTGPIAAVPAAAQEEHAPLPSAPDATGATRIDQDIQMQNPESSAAAARTSDAARLSADGSERARNDDPSGIAARAQNDAAAGTVNAASGASETAQGTPDAVLAARSDPAGVNTAAVEETPGNESLADAGTSLPGRRASEAAGETGTPAVIAPPRAAYVEQPDFWAATRIPADSRSAATDDGMQALRAVPAAGEQYADTRGYFPMLNRTGVLRFVTVELRGVSAASFPEATIGSRSNPWMQNMAVAVYYSDEQDDLGLEFGQEAFSQHYDGIEFGRPVHYEQNLLASWLLAGYRHRFDPLFGALEPYVTIGAGSTLQAWPLARAGAGLMYMPDSRVRFHIGLEGAVLAYPFQDRWFTTRRAGLSYGISLLL